MTIPSYIHNSSDLLNQLNNIKYFLIGCKLFTSDPTSMYTNIDPDEGVNTLRSYLCKYAHEGKGSMLNTEMICEMTKLVMENIISKIGDSYWKQNVGTVMGTKCECKYATILFTWFEREWIQEQETKQ
jgi:hypothetical protein